MVRKRTAMKMRKVTHPQANGQLRMTRTRTSTPRSRKPTKMTRQHIYIFFKIRRKTNKRPARPVHFQRPVATPPPWSPSPSRANLPAMPPPLGPNARKDSPAPPPPSVGREPLFPQHQNFKALLSFLKIL